MHAMFIASKSSAFYRNVARYSPFSIDNKLFQSLTVWIFKQVAKRISPTKKKRLCRFPEYVRNSGKRCCRC